MSLLEIYRGDSKSYDLTFTNGDGEAIDITGWTIFFTAKEKRTDSDDDAVMSKDVTNHSDPTGGVSAISFTASETNIDPKAYYYDIQVKKADGTIRTVLVNKLQILIDITRRTT